MLAVSQVAATEEKLRFYGSFPFLTIAYTSRAVIFGHVLVTWNPKILGVMLAISSLVPERQGVRDEVEMTRLLLTILTLTELS